jgi:hypothetical protein
MARLVRRENIDLQSKKITEVAEALVAAGYVCLDEQARALGLPRSTTWTILNGKHKNTGLSASVIKQILAQPQLPNLVRRKVVEYVEEKSSGVYGHNPQRARRFSSGLDGCALDGRAWSPLWS